MSLLSKTQAQLKSCRFQFTKLVENNKILCEAILEAKGSLSVLSADESLHAIAHCVCVNTLEKIKQCEEKLK